MYRPWPTFMAIPKKSPFGKHGRFYFVSCQKATTGQLFKENPTRNNIGSRPFGFFDPTGRPRRQHLFYAKKNRGAIFFGVDRWGAFSKKRTPKAEKNDWLRALIKKGFL